MAARDGCLPGKHADAEHRAARVTVASALLTAMIACASMAAAQDVLDRILARVDGSPITLSDARAAITLGLVETTEGVDPVLSAMRQLVERRLVLAEVSRFAPADPDPVMLNGEVNALKARVGAAGDLARLEKATGYGEEQVAEVARDNLRMQAYLNQRFGSTVQPTDEEVGQYYRTHLDEFTRNGRVIPFVEAESLARQKAAAERRRAIIFQWMRELRQRADVVELYPSRPASGR